MAAVDSLRTHFVEELADLLDAEAQLVKALPKMAQAATTKPLKVAFEKHLKETRGHITRLNQALERLGERPSRKTCAGMKALLSEGEDVMKKAPAGAVRDAVLITAAQKVEHYEMASYGTARTYATVLGENAVARLLQQTLREEKAADGKLTSIAEASVNEDAAEEWRSQDEPDGLLERSARWLGRAVASTRRQMSGAGKTPSPPAAVAHDRPARRRASTRGRRRVSRAKRTRSRR